MERDNRVFFDTESGEIIAMTGEIQGDVLPLKENQTIDYVDVPFGSVDYLNTIIKGVDPEKRTLITELIDNRTEEQKKIAELEEQLLLLSGVI